MRSLRSLLLLAALPAMLPAQVTRRVQGDTTFILTKGNGAWGSPQAAVEVVRIGGAATHETTFGGVRSITALPDGGVIVFDERSLDGPVVRRFNAEGRFVGNLGRAGAGPGEYRGGIDIKSSADGRIWLTDIANSRVNIYRADGKFEKTFRIPGYMWTYDLMRLGRGGDIYLLVPIFPPKGGAAPRRETKGYFRIDSTGRVLDTIIPPPALGGANDDPFQATILSGGRVVTAARDRVGFTITAPNGRAPVTVVARDLPRVAYSARERHLIDSVRKRSSRDVAEDGAHPSQAPPPIPEFKQPYSMVKVGPDDRIWWHRNVADDGRKVESGMWPPAVFDAFEPSGRYLGEVTLPGQPETMSLSFGATVAWAMVTGKDDEVYLVKYRIR